MHRTPALAAAALLLALAAPAAAQEVACDSLPEPVYVPGTSDVKPYLARVAPKLASASPEERLTIVYQSMGSCSAIDAVRLDAELTGTAIYWSGATNPDGSPIEGTCTISAGTKPSLAFSDVTYRTCTGEAIAAPLRESSSYVQGFGFVVPESSTQRAITATEAYFLLKFGGEAGRTISPWDDPTLVAIRTPAASTQLLVGLASGVPGTQWSPRLTNVNNGSGDVINYVAAAAATPNAEKTLGILSLQRYDGARDRLNMLAFEAFDQCLGALWPDSTPDAFDKANVRDGHYAIWGYLWSVRRTPATNELGERLISFVEGSAAIHGADPILDAARAGAIPACAMRVRRDYDGAPLQSFSPDQPCGCAYEAAVAGATSCAACATNADCPTSACRFGYCEER